jgi:DNA-directed RNA polymerase, mitochondrial
MDAIDATVEALTRKDEREIRNFGLGSTDGAQKLITRHFETYMGLFEEAVDEAKGLRGRRRELLTLNVEVLTLASLEAAISSFRGIRVFQNEEMDDLSKVLWFIGRRLEGECYGNAFRHYMAEEAERIERAVKRSAGNLAYRKRLLKQIAREKGFVYEDWLDNDILKGAEWILNVLLKGPMFTLDEDRQFTMTPEALSEVETIMGDLVLMKPRCLPQVGPVVDWEGTYIHIDSLRFPMVRTHMKAVRKFVEREFRTGCMGPTIEALNHAQSVLWRINEPLLDSVRWAYHADLGRTVGLPAKSSLAVPEKPSENLPETERFRLLRERRDKKIANRGFIGERIGLEQNLAMAESLPGKPFWTPMNLDYRGRFYAIPQLNFQGADHIRSLFLFEEGQVLTEEGMYWLKAHVANCGAFDKIDKAPFDDRVKWVEDNLAWIDAVAYAPEHERGWMSADSPFMFVAACRALCDALAGHPCHLPVSFDGTCSGLQHLCAMTRAPEGALVNLTPSERPNDVYQVVADRVRAKVEADLGGELDAFAKAFLAYGISRSLVKRNVMTYSYSSKARGMTEQLMDDTMRPLSTKVLIGDLSEHPFGQDWIEVSGKAVSRHWQLSSYMAKHTYAAIEEVVEGPAKAMAFLREIAGAYAHEGKPTIWHTPLGFPVMMRYPNITTKQVELFLQDKAIRIQPRCSLEVPGILKAKSKNGVSPSFVHSLDACHLMKVLLECKQEGINSIALVHDSFGCLPNDCGRFRTIIKRTFRDLYTDNDVLEAIRKEAEERLENPQLPELPTYGTLDLNQIMQADYCFA